MTADDVLRLVASERSPRPDDGPRLADVATVRHK